MSTDTSAASVGVIVVTYQSARHVEALWRSVGATLDPRRFAIYVVDNDSTDETLEIIARENKTARLRVEVIRNPTNVGFAAATNQGFSFLTKEASPEFFVLLNPDTIVHPGWWEPLLRCLEEPGAGIAVPLLLLPDGTINSRGNALHFLGFGYVQGLGEKAEGIDPQASFFSGSGAALALRADALTSINRLFDQSGIFWEELFMYAEDTDLGWRFRLAGLAPRLCPASRVTHDYRFPAERPEAGIDRLFWIERNRYLLMLANFKLRTLCLLLPWIAASEFALGVGLWKLYPHRVKLWRAVASEARKPAFRERRKKIQQARRVGDREILRAMTGSILHGARRVRFVDLSLDFFLRASHRVLEWLVCW